MSFVQQIADAIGSAHPRALDTLSRSIWQGLAAGALNDDDAQRLAELIHARRIAEKAAAEARGGSSGPRGLYPLRKPQRAPVRAIAIERRRRLASSGPLPPSVAARFTTGELAVLRIVGDECRVKGACTLPLAAIAARAGVCRKLAQNAIRLARRENLLAYEERRRPGQVNLTNVLTIASTEWKAWLTRGPRPERGGGKKFAPTDTSSHPGTSRDKNRSERLPEGRVRGGQREVRFLTSLLTHPPHPGRGPRCVLGPLQRLDD